MDSVLGAGGNYNTTIAQQEKEFQKAVQPGSPISALLSSARQPLLMGSSNNGVGGRDNLFRKLQAVQRESPLGKRSLVRNADGTIEDRRSELGSSTRVREPTEDDLKAKKELEAQKARIVAQMAPVREEEEDAMDQDQDQDDIPQLKAHREAPKPKLSRHQTLERENVPPAHPGLKASSSMKPLRDPRLGQSSLGSSIPGKVFSFFIDILTNISPKATVSTKSLPAVPAQPSGFETTAQVLSLAFDSMQAGKLFRDPRQDPSQPLYDERVFIVSWVDYCNKYGMGYALTDGSCGVYFNDSTSIVLSPNKRYVSLCSR